MNLVQLDNLFEGRKLEFKETFPSGNKIEKTAVAFSKGV